MAPNLDKLQCYIFKISISFKIAPLVVPVYIYTIRSFWFFISLRVLSLRTLFGGMFWAKIEKFCGFFADCSCVTQGKRTKHTGDMCRPKSHLRTKNKPNLTRGFEIKPNPSCFWPPKCAKTAIFKSSTNFGPLYLREYATDQNQTLSTYAPITKLRHIQKLAIKC